MWNHIEQNRLEKLEFNDAISNGVFNPISPGQFNTFSTWGGGGNRTPP